MHLSTALFSLCLLPLLLLSSVIAYPHTPFRHLPHRDVSHIRVGGIHTPPTDRSFQPEDLAILNAREKLAREEQQRLTKRGHEEVEGVDVRSLDSEIREAREKVAEEERRSLDLEDVRTGGGLTPTGQHQTHRRSPSQPKSQAPDASVVETTGHHETNKRSLPLSRSQSWSRAVSEDADREIREEREALALKEQNEQTDQRKWD